MSDRTATSPVGAVGHTAQGRIIIRNSWNATGSDQGFRYASQAYIQAAFVAITFVSATGGATTMPERIVLTEQNQGQAVEVRVGQPVVLSLPENATTGYRWAIDHLDSSLVQASEPTARYPSTAVGSGGRVVWEFQAKAPGNTEVALKPMASVGRRPINRGAFPRATAHRPLSLGADQTDCAAAIAVFSARSSADGSSGGVRQQATVLPDWRPHFACAPDPWS